MTSSRLQLALNVSDLGVAVERYTAVFGQGPSKERPGYANFLLSDPPLKLVLFENPHGTSALNHLGVELGSADDVRAAAEQFAARGLAHSVAESDVCCHARQDKVWVDVPDVPLGAWEFYTVLDDDPAPDVRSDSLCCATPDSAAGPCCE
ncbi:MAG TPA: ArsI/CadI family heavy metal resistance metalloenzyme [Actinomycetes bacterium]|nr:ArsI/CadI family heavy metal resistance metalloenzyme [Actinomycetes bacterium]